jgi:coiled-coil-helix-coiled-coil-helix domain-containing protein 10
MQPQGGGMLSGIGSTIVQGMAFGTGSAIAHRAVGAVAGSFGGGSDAAPAPLAAAAPEYAQGAMSQPQSSADSCSMDKQMFYECLNQNKGDQQACNFLYEQLKTCQSGQSQTTFY